MGGHLGGNLREKTLSVGDKSRIGDPETTAWLYGKTKVSEEKLQDIG